MQKHSNKALWRTYFFIVFFSIAAAGTFLNLKWLDIKADAIFQQSYSNKLIANSIVNYLNKYEVFLEVVGKRMLNQLSANKPFEAKKLLENMMLGHPELAAISLVNGQGEVILSSLDKSQLEQKTLISNPKTKDAFLNALSNQMLIMGRTYLMPSLKEWVVPLIMPIKDETALEASMMVALLKLDNLEREWLGESLPEFIKLMVLRSDLYRQFSTSIDLNDYAELIDKPLPTPVYKSIIKTIKEQTGKSPSDVQNEGLVLSYVAPGNDGKLNLQTASYNTKYQHYIITSTSFVHLYNRLLSPSSWMLLFLILFNFGLYLLFRNNLKIQTLAKASLQHQIEHDPLTKLPNRRYLLNHYDAWAATNDHEHSLLYLDLINFKACNDIYGHSTGDKILCAAADRLTEFFSDSLCARQGGDEFIILSPITNESVLLEKCEAFLMALAKIIHVEHLEFSILASIGISFAPQDGASLDELLRKADMAMYEAKRKQRHIGVYTDELEAKTKQASDIEHELKSALHNDEFSVVYQPQVDAYSYQVLGIEALLRWNNPTLGFVPPDVFIPVAESSGLINEIGRFVMEQALKDGQDISQACNLKHKLRVSVNLSVSQLFNDDFIAHLESLLEKYQGQAISFMLEVTESLFIDDLIRAKSILEKAKSFGIYISLDDFGTGYSSLSVLSKLPINELKIDRSFVNDILTDENDWLLAKSIIYLCKSLSIPVVAEGVENKAQADRLAAHGCDVFQGYYFAKPMHKEDLKAFLNAQK